MDIIEKMVVLLVEDGSRVIIAMDVEKLLWVLAEGERDWMQLQI